MDHHQVISRALNEGEINLLNGWYEKCVEYNQGHGDAAGFYNKLKNLFAVLLFMFPTGASVMIKQQGKVPHAETIAAALALCAAVCIAIRGNLNFRHLYSMHQASRLKWRELENEVKDVFFYNEAENPLAIVRHIRARYDELLASDPLIPTFLVMGARKQLEKIGVKRLSPKRNPLPGANTGNAKEFRPEQITDLNTILSQAQKNRVHTIKEALFNNSMDKFLGCLLAALSVMSTAVAFGSVVASKEDKEGDRPLEKTDYILKEWTQLVNGLTAGCAVLDATMGFSTKLQMFQEYSTNWSSLAREIESILAMKLHPDPDGTVLQIELKTRHMVDELMKDNMTFIPKAKAPVQVEVSDKENYTLLGEAEVEGG